MKIRNGFVSNSSSSSFIVSVENVKNVSKEERQKFVDECIRLCTDWGMEEEDKLFINMLQTAVDKGNILIEIEVDYSDTENYPFRVLDSLNVNYEVIHEN